MQIRFEMCVCTLLNANPVVEGVGAHALKGRKTASTKPSYFEVENWTNDVDQVELISYAKPTENNIDF